MAYAWCFNMLLSWSFWASWTLWAIESQSLSCSEWPWGLKLNSWNKIQFSAADRCHREQEWRWAKTQTVLYYSLVWNQPLGTQSTPAESHEQQPGWSQHPEPSQRSQKSSDDQLHVSLMTRDIKCTGLLSRSSFYQWHGCAQGNPNPLLSAFNLVRRLLAWAKAFYAKINWAQAELPIFILKFAWLGFCQPRSLS